MGIKDQFQDKANDLKDKAQKAAQGAKGEASQRSAKIQDKSKTKPQGQADRARDEFDENWDV
ncbi:hypothetical protein ACFTWH_13035 [Streptomyces sp. NPDC057011]|uniref:hypothetical protein n=1 Tax=unclassified Streptomyces TaxID=2593676 RepID=UPI003638F4DD